MPRSRVRLPAHDLTGTERAALIRPRTLAPFYEGSATHPAVAVASALASGAADAASAAAAWSAPPLVRDRADAPRVYAHARGDRRLALAIINDPTSLDAAVSALNSDIFAQSAGNPRASKLKTWLGLAAAVNPSEPSRLSDDVVRKVCAALKGANFRSIGSYITIAKQHHLLLHGELPPAIPLLCTWFSRSGKRGQGPGKHTQPLPFWNIATLTGDPVEWAVNGPLYPRRAITIGSWWLLRELELSCARITAATLVGEGATMVGTLLLPASKRDPSAIGETRSLSCACESAGASRCPAHLLASQRLFAQAAADKFGIAHNEFPLFPARSRSSCTKLGVTATLQHAARLLGVPLQHHNGADSITGHAMRATGAIALANAGIPQPDIALFARWGSDTFKIYVERAPLLALEGLAVTASLNENAVHPGLADALAMHSSSGKGARRCPVVGEALIHNTLPVDGDAEGRLHAAHPVNPSSTRCGWCFVGATHAVRTTSWDVGTACDACFLHLSASGESGSDSHATLG
jgi:hypothetical protein